MKYFSDEFVFFKPVLVHAKNLFLKKVYYLLGFKKNDDNKLLTMKNKIKYKKVFGLTGIMGSGKSTAAAMLGKKGAVILDADQFAKLVLSNKYADYNEVLDNILAKFAIIAANLYKKSIVNDVNEIDRKLLGKIVFENEKYIEKLNSIIHPHVEKLFFNEIDRVKDNKIMVYDVPLLFETGMHKMVKKTIVVYTPEQIAIKRAAAKTGLAEGHIKSRLTFQISIEEKRNSADYLIDNSKTLIELKNNVDDVWQKIKQI